MEIINFDDCARPSTSAQRHYGGHSGNKEHILIGGENWFLKYPANIRGKSADVALSRANTPLGEYLGSKVYEILGIPVHETMLGVGRRSGHVLVACKDFLSNGEKLDEFSQIKVSCDPHDLNSSSSSGMSCNLDEIVGIVKSNEFLRSVEGVEDRFWDMFVIDAFIGNSDRNNGNWGVIRKLDGTNLLAPVYGNGNSFNNKWDLDKIRDFQSSHEKFIGEAYAGRVCIFSRPSKNGEERKITPFKLMESMEFKELNAAVQRLAPRISREFGNIERMIDEIPNSFEGIPIISDEQKRFYVDLLRTRCNQVLVPTAEKARTADIPHSFSQNPRMAASRKSRGGGWSR